MQISSGTEQQQHKVDNFIGKKASEVLASDQFEPWYYFETMEQYSEEFAKGVVANQSIQSGTTIGRKTTITLYVSKGSASEPLPQLVGKTPEEAITILGEMNKQYKIINGSSRAVDEGKIFSHRPAGRDTDEKGQQRCCTAVCGARCAGAAKRGGQLRQSG